MGNLPSDTAALTGPAGDRRRRAGPVTLGRVEVALLVPVKAFTAAKARLAPHLHPHERARLARWLADRVVGAAGGLPVFVACDDDEVASWADGVGAEVLWSPGLGLNGAVDAGRATIAGKGFEHVVIAHSDLPLAHGFDRLAAAGTITLVPDRHRDGTNVLTLPVGAPVPASYGAGSFAAHLRLALDSGLAVRVVTDHRLGLDLDRADDVWHPLARPVLPSWLPTIPANRP